MEWSLIRYLQSHLCYLIYFKCIPPPCPHFKVLYLIRAVQVYQGENSDKTVHKIFCCQCPVPTNKALEYTQCKKALQEKALQKSATGSAFPISIQAGCPINWYHDPKAMEVLQGLVNLAKRGRAD